MEIKGIRISDSNEIDGIGPINFSGILKEIQNGDTFYWSILFLNARGDLGEGRSIPVFQKEISDSKNGFFIDWKGLNSLVEKLEEIYGIIVIGCENEYLLKRYTDDQKMYETCDIVIELIDSAFWEVFSKDESLIQRLFEKFNKVEFLKTDFQTKPLESQGIRVFDKKNDKNCVDFRQILLAFKKKNAYYWSILLLETSKDFLLDITLEKQIRENIRGLQINWEDLKILAEKLNQIINITVVGCTKVSLIQRYKTDQEMYEKCSVVIQMIDGAFWQVYSTNEQFIDNIADKFHEIEFLESYYQTWFLQ